MSLSRRRFLVDGLRVCALVPVLPGHALPRLWRRAEGEPVLVVVQLAGGNDGLNTVVPHRQDAYARLRPTLGLGRSSLHALDADHGLHPALARLGPLFDAGRLSVLHGVGYPGPSRSHFRSLEIWHSAEPDAPPRGIGWLGRMADQIASAAPGSMPALHVGDEDLPLALRGEHGLAPAVRDESGLRLDGPALLADERERLLAGAAEGPGELAFLRSAARDAYRAASRLEEAVARTSGGDYPDLELARKLRLVARLVAGGFDTRIFLVTLGGFDTHARQAALHAAQLEELARSLAAFEGDLAARGVAPRVATLVFSEFGRRAAENASRGTDHGAAAPVFLLGGPGRGGLVGTPPDVERLVDGDVPHSTDFRALYACLERNWMGLRPSSTVAPLELGD
jgi:uncharacterized protein (DUF1501 family)